MHKVWSGRRAHEVKYENINNLDDMSLASFRQRKAVCAQHV